MARYWLILGLVLLTSACAGRPGTATKYRPMNLFGGYKDEVVEPGVWRVVARANGIAEGGFGRNMAVYRAAEVVKAAGFSHMQIIDQKGQQTSFGVGGGPATHSAGEWMEIYVRGANDEAAPAECRAKDTKACFTVPVDRILVSIRPLLTFPEDGS